jgi:hypothetical protein
MIGVPFVEGTRRFQVARQQGRHDGMRHKLKVLACRTPSSILASTNHKKALSKHGNNEESLNESVIAVF